MLRATKHPDVSMSGRPTERCAPTSDDFAIVPVEGQTPLCGGCSSLGHCRLGILDVEFSESNTVTVRATCDPMYRGGPIVAHGGWIASIFDDALAFAVLRDNPRVVTRDLAVQYRRPVPVSRPLLISAQVIERDDRVWAVTAQMWLDDDPDAILATASAHFVARRDGYYARHEEEMKKSARQSFSNASPVCDHH